MFIFFHVEENEPKEDALAPLTLRVTKPASEAAPHAAMRRCPIRSGAHNLTIAARLASLGALHDSMMLASMTGFNRTGLAETRCAQTVREPSPFDPLMLGAVQRGKRKPNRFVRHLPENGLMPFRPSGSGTLGGGFTYWRIWRCGPRGTRGSVLAAAGGTGRPGASGPFCGRPAPVCKGPSAAPP